ncbi:DUF305 domain-containing protein [Ornithinimicrobium cerasi]|uniref:Uncharacterized conserved protein, DUF305 family n=1 Tax=Ornithinimicrobium cerasi TaxID=2248773 RepID=A0A285VPR6_9MICO|nr:DUF305 domain-containing protein [Ornithinimicrobium cerasi]SOC56049.1 Uncharacterized conserved protein, DUF305 family [Ornithinimicrobium cerasi]
MSMITGARKRCGVGLAALALMLTGCSSAEPEAAVDRGVEPTTETFTADARVIIPGRPGEEPTVLEPGETGEVLGGGFTEAEARFMEQMIPHHAQALEMAELAEERAEDEQLKVFAERIAISQGPEIDVMTTWLTDRGLPVPEVEPTSEHGPHSTHAGMPGMVTPEQMVILEKARGVEFERTFLTYMIAHHQGAIEMAQPVLGGALDPRAEEMANDVSNKQAIEIERMQEMLDARS